MSWWQSEEVTMYKYFVSKEDISGVYIYGVEYLFEYVYDKASGIESAM